MASNNWETDPNGNPYELVTAADDEDTEDENASMLVTDSSTEDEDDGVEELPHGTNVTKHICEGASDMDMADAVSSSAMVVRPKQKQMYEADSNMAVARRRKQSRKRKTPNDPLPKADEIAKEAHRKRTIAKKLNLRRIQEDETEMDIC